MGIWRKVKRFLPPSSRSFHQMFGEMNDFRHDMCAFRDDMGDFRRETIASLDQRFGELRDEIGRVRQDVDHVRDRQERLALESENRDRQNRIYLELLYSEDGESAADARRRMFAAIPPAEGAIRLHQLANAHLMSKLDALCSELYIDYWFAYGTLVAALSRHGFIPWDDDIDICMMREDIERLRAYLEGDPDYQVTVVYDRFVLCKQMRFSSTDESIPCFIDLSIWDHATSSSQEMDDAMRQARLDMMEELENLPRSDYWREFPYLFAPGSGPCVQAGPSHFDKQDPVLAAEQVGMIEDVIGRYQRRAREDGILCDEERAEAVAYGIDNIYDAPWRRVLWEKDLMFPTRRCAFEDYEFLVPNKAEEVMQECYPGSPFLPDDIVGHEHFAYEDYDGAQIRAALIRFIGE